MGNKYISKSEKKIWSPDQLDKIAKLRESQEVLRRQKPFIMVPGEPLDKRVFNVGDKVYCDNMHAVVTKRELSQSGHYLYEAKSRDRVFENLHCWNLRPRTEEDLSHIVVPEEIKARDTKSLLAEYRRIRREDPASAQVLKAELSTREHVPNKKERQTEKKKKSRNRNRY